MMIRPGHLNLVAVTMLLYGCNYEPREIYPPQTNPPPPTLTIPAPSTGEAVKLSRCTPDPNYTQSGLPACEIYRDPVFVTESLTSIILAVSGKPGNRRCCLTAQVQDGGSYQTCYTKTAGVNCLSGFTSVP